MVIRCFILYKTQNWEKRRHEIGFIMKIEIKPNKTREKKTRKYQTIRTKNERVKLKKKKTNKDRFVYRFGMYCICLCWYNLTTNKRDHRTIEPRINYAYVCVCMHKWIVTSEDWHTIGICFLRFISFDLPFENHCSRFFFVTEFFLPVFVCMYVCNKYNCPDDDNNNNNKIQKV